MAIQKITVGIDFSSHSNIALKQATWLAKQTGATLCLVHVTAPGGPKAAALVSSVRVWEQIVEIRAAQEEATADLLAKRTSEAGVPATYQIVSGNPGEELVKVAEAEDSEVIIVGAHGLIGSSLFSVGSSALEVVRSSRSNVWVARRSNIWGTGPKRILLATDFSEYSEEALRVAIEIAPDDSTIEIVHSWRVPVLAAPTALQGAPSASLAGIADDLEEYAEKQGKELIESHATPRLHLKFEPIRGPAAASVIDYAKGHPNLFDLIVTGSHGRRGFRRFFLGSVAEKIVKHAPCSVLVVHRKGGSQAQ
jgi:nucleotide-binding universal stress UspA family protein